MLPFAPPSVAARTFPQLKSGVVPDRHLRQFSKARIPTVTIVGDSTFTTAADGLSQSLYAASEIARRFRECNPGRSFTFSNRALPGTTMNLINSTGTAINTATGIALPSWFSVAGAAWSTYIQNTAPDAVVLGFGMNGGSAWPPTTIATFRTATQSWTKIPDLIWCTPLVPSLNSDLGTSTEQDARDQAAGYIRTSAICDNEGLIDFHRMMRAVRDGIDVTDTEARRVSETYDGVLPYTYTGEALHDFRIVGTFVGQRNTLLAGGAVVSFQIGNRTDNTFQLSLSGGNYSIGIYRGSGVFYDGFTSSTAPTAGDLQLEVECRGANLYVAVDGLVLWNAPVPRFGGAFRPYMSRSASPGSFTFRVDSAWAGQPKRINPTAADLLLWDPSNDGDYGGAKNHPTSIGVSRIYRPVLDATDLRQVGTGPIHDITAATTIAAGVSQVRMTGPSSGTYAVTLSAPDRRDAGRVLEIEMVSTTGTNAVTIALTNVDGGSASTSASFDAAGEKLILVAGISKWTVIKELGVTLT